MWRRRRDAGFSAELESHVEMHMADNVRAGMTPEEMRRQALIALGGLEPAKERYRDQRRWRFVMAQAKGLGSRDWGLGIGGLGS